MDMPAKRRTAHLRLSTNFRLLAVRYLDLHPLSQERAVTAKEQALWYNILLFCWDISADIKL